MLTGKGWFIWQVSKCEGGSPSAIAAKAAAAGLSHVLLKIADRNYSYGIDRHGNDLVAPLVAALQGRKIQAWGWHYVYGQQPADEAQAAVNRVNQLGLDGYVIDAEGEYEQPHMDGPAHTFMAALKDGLPANVPIALSSYRYPSVHRNLPWAAFLQSCDLAMPQVYWMGSHNADVQLARTVKEYADARLVGTPRPVVPTGSAYGSGDWTATPADLKQFLDQALKLKLLAANFYSWDAATVPDAHALWDTVAAYEYGSSASDQANDALIRNLFAALNAGDLAALGRLYAQNAAYVTAERTLFGVGTIVAALQTFLKSTLPGAVFTLTSLVGTGHSRQAHWTAIGTQGQIHDGDDTFGILGGQIVYHSTQFTITETVVQPLHAQ